MKDRGLRMKLQSVEIQDTFGIEHCKFAPKSVTLVSGKNGSGKSSIIKSIAKVFEGGKNPEIIRKGAKKSIVTLTLSDGISITKTTTAKSSTVEIQDRDGNVIGAPMTYVGQLSEAMAVDPARILKIDAGSAVGRKELVSLLLELMPLSWTADEINQAVSQWHSEPLASADVDLSAIDKIRADLTEKRRRIGVQARDAEGTVQSLRKALPEQDEKDWGAEVRRLESEADAVLSKQSEELGGVTAEARDARKKQSDSHFRTEEKLRSKFQEELEALRSENHRIEQAINAAEVDANREITERYEPERSRLMAGMATATERHQAQLKASGVRDSVKEWERKCSDANGLYQQLTFAVEELDKLKKTKLDSLPIQGLEFSEDRILIDGVEWQNCNTARRVEIAMQLSALRAGDLSLLLLDDAEHLDSETRRLLEQGIADSGFQLIEAVVHDCPLRIETVPAGTVESHA